MKKLLTLALLAALSYNVSAQTKAKPAIKKPVATTKKPTTAAVKPAIVFKNNLDSACYALGLNVANSFKSGGLKTINYEMFNKGLRDAFLQSNPTLTQQEAQEVINKLFESLSSEREKAEKEKYADNVNAGTKFLTENKAKPGIKTTASGLQYEVITAGTGANPKATDQVTVNYKGTLLNGKQFDSSYDRGEPASFGLNQVIPGWTEGLQLMNEGAKFRFFIPYNLAYGSRATPDGSIPPFSTLIFEVELIKINNQ